jgi:hypothetical protein
MSWANLDRRIDRLAAGAPTGMIRVVGTMAGLRTAIAEVTGAHSPVKPPAEVTQSLREAIAAGRRSGQKTRRSHRSQSGDPRSGDVALRAAMLYSH